MRFIGPALAILLVAQAYGQNDALTGENTGAEAPAPLGVRTDTDTGEIIPRPVEDASLEAPRIVEARPYQSDDGAFSGLSFTWNAVPEAVSYGIWREIAVSHRPDEGGDLVELDEPEMYFLPWAEVEHAAGITVGRAIVSTLDNVVTRWGISAAFERDGRLLRSPIRIYEVPVGVTTAVAATTWGRVKSGLK